MTIDANCVAGICAHASTIQPLGPAQAEPRHIQPIDESSLGEERGLGPQDEFAAGEGLYFDPPRAVLRLLNSSNEVALHMQELVEVGDEPALPPNVPGESALDVYG